MLRSIIVALRKPRPSPAPRARREQPRGERWLVDDVRPCCSEHATGIARHFGGGDYDHNGEQSAFDHLIYAAPWHSLEPDIETGHVRVTGERWPESAATGRRVTQAVAVAAYRESFHAVAVHSEGEVGGLWDFDEERSTVRAPAARRRATPRKFR